jgi:Domain of unknown function (DUF4062)
VRPSNPLSSAATGGPSFTIRPRVFVSSVVEDFQAYREAARAAIHAAGGEPILVNEDFSSMQTSSRNACLDAVASSDIFVLTIGARGGWRAPSGRLVVEEELEEARRRRLPILVFIEEVEQDVDAKHLSSTVSDYVDGYFRVRFRGPDGLGRELARALPPLIQTAQRPAMSPDELSACFEHPYKVGDQTTLRFVLVPERREEIIDPVRLGSGEFADRLLELGHSKSIGLFSYQRAKEPPSLSNDSLIIEQPAGNDWRRGIQAVRMELHESGAVVFDSNVTGRTERANSSDVMGIFRIAIEDVEAALAADFRFASAVYEEVDPYKRHQRLFWNAALSNLGYRSFARNPQPEQAYTMNTSERSEPALAFPAGRPIDRLILAQPAREIERAIHTWTKKQSKGF